MKIQRIRKISPFSLAFFFTFALSTVFAQEPLRREKIRENLHTLRLLRMTQALDLTEEQAAKIFPFFNRVEKEKVTINRKIGRVIQDLRELLREEKPKEEEISGQMAHLRELRELLRAKDRELENFMEKNLSEIQKAKYILFSIDFYRTIEENLEKARRLRGRDLPLPKKEGKEGIEF